MPNSLIGLAMSHDAMSRFNCSQCAKRLKAPVGSEGKRFTCPKCQTKQVMPSFAKLPLDVRLQAALYIDECEAVARIHATPEAVWQTLIVLFLVWDVKRNNGEVVFWGGVHVTFDCPACGHHLRCERDVVGKRVSCTHCGKTFVVSPESDELIESQLADGDAHNPFGRALFGVWTQMKTMEWSFPFLHNLVSMVILLFVIGMLVILYPTIGLSIHLAGISVF